MSIGTTGIRPSQMKAEPAPRLTIGMLSTLPPTLCGLATFASALSSAMEEAGALVKRIGVDEAVERQYSRNLSLTPGSPQSRAQVAHELNRCDVAVIQHEFGIYGGPDGQEILELLGAVNVPMIVVLHTVPARPNANQLRILQALIRSADSVIVMSQSARAQLHTLVGEPVNLSMIPHGAATRELGERPAPAGRSIDLLTWGLIGPGKGIEGAITALGLARALGVELRYTVAGVTHPKVVRREGDAYVASLRELARRQQVDDLVEFDHVYRGVQAMLPFIESASVVVLPYESREQVTSGVLVDSLAAGRPVIATAFPHARELLANGSGRIVEHDNPVQMATAMVETRNADALEAMAARALELAPSLSWATVARSYLQICNALVLRHRLAV